MDELHTSHVAHQFVFQSDSTTFPFETPSIRGVNHFIPHSSCIYTSLHLQKFPIAS